jgi:hypothetical protein
MSLLRAASLTLVRTARIELARLPWQSSAYASLLSPREVVDREGLKPSSHRLRAGCSVIELTIHVFGVNDET